MPFNGKIPQVFLVEDSEDDSFFFERIVRRSGIPLELTPIHNGMAAVEALKKICGDHPISAPPDLIFLDLKMPDFNGFEVLAWVQQQPALSHLKIIVLSGSEDAADIIKAKSLGAVACFTKPIQVEQLRFIMETYGLVSAGPENRTSSDNTDEAKSA
jgi:CheY-like chemotaxis protein